MRLLSIHPDHQNGVLYLHTTENSVEQKKCPFDFSRRNSAFLEAFDVVSVSELNDVFITLPT